MPEGFVGNRFPGRTGQLPHLVPGLPRHLLPTLLFETALAIDVRRMVNDVAPILLMAVVAVVVCMVVVGVTLCQPHLLWPDRLPDARRHHRHHRSGGGGRRLPRDRRASRLTMLVEGESLLNDAAAIALFGMLAACCWRAASVLGRRRGRFPGEVLGGAAVGGAMGLGVCYLFPLLKGFTTAEITLTVALAYLSFFVGEHYFHVSGCRRLRRRRAGGRLARPHPHVAAHPRADGRRLGPARLLGQLAHLPARRHAGAGIMSRTSWAEVGIILALYIAALVARIIVVAGCCRC
jgi:CPA1 family monovalent cation:H+ antiporter